MTAQALPILAFIFSFDTQHAFAAASTDPRLVTSCSQKYQQCRSTCSKTCAQTGPACYATNPPFLTTCQKRCSDELNTCDEPDPSNQDAVTTIGEATCAEVEILNSCEEMWPTLFNRNTKYYPIDPTTCPGPEVDQAYPVYRSDPLPDTDSGNGQGPSYAFIWRTKQVFTNGFGNVPDWYITGDKAANCGNVAGYMFYARIRDTQKEEPFLFEDPTAPQEVRCRVAGPTTETKDLQIRCNRLVDEQGGPSESPGTNPLSGDDPDQSSAGIMAVTGMAAGVVVIMAQLFLM